MSYVYEYFTFKTIKRLSNSETELKMAFLIKKRAVLRIRKSE